MTEQLFHVDEFLQTKSVFEVAAGTKKIPSVNVAWHVIEVNLQTCSAGTQIWYTCRPHIPETNRYDRSFRDWTGNELRKFNQIELEHYQPPKPDPVLNLKDELGNPNELMKEIIELVSKHSGLKKDE